MYDGYYRRGGSVIGAFLLGGLVGAVIGLLFAPRSGKETRDLIADKAGEYWGEAGELYETGKEKVTEVASTAKETAAEKGEELRAKIDEARGRLQETVAKSADAAKGKIDEVAPAAKEAVDKAAAGAKTGIDVASTKASGGLDYVAKKTAVEPADAVADVTAAADDAAAAVADKKGDNPLPEL